MKKLSVLLLSVFAFLIFTTSIQAGYHRVACQANPGDIYGTNDAYSTTISANVSVSASLFSWSTGDAVAKAAFEVDGNEVARCMSWYEDGTRTASYSYTSSNSTEIYGWTYCVAGNGVSVAYIEISWN